MTKEEQIAIVSKHKQNIIDWLADWLSEESNEGRKDIIIRLVSLSDHDLLEELGNLSSYYNPIEELNYYGVV